MKVDKALANMMLSTLGQSMVNISTVTNKECVVISLWSGNELDTTEKNAVTASVDANGLIPGNWTANFSGRTELARLTLTNFTNRAIGNDLDVDWSLSNRGEQFAFMNAGVAGAFSIFMCSNSFAGYAAGAGNTGRMLLVGTVSDLQGSGDLKLNSTTISSQSRIRIPDVKMIFNYLNYANTWSGGSGGGVGPVEDEFWSQTLFLAKFDGSGLEEKSSTQMVTTGVVGFTPLVESPTPGDQAATLDGSSWFDFSNYNLSSLAPGAGDFTLEIFTVLGNTTGIRELAADFLAYQGGARPVIQIDATSRRVQYLHGTTTILNTVVNSIAPGKLAHIAVQRRGTSLELYVNGRRLRTATNSETILMSTLRVGVSTTASTAYIGAVGSMRYTRGVARYSKQGFYPSFQQFDRLIQVESALDHSATVFEVDFSVSNKDLISDLPMQLGYVNASPLVTYTDEEAVFNMSASLTTTKTGYGLGTAYTIEAYFTPTAGQSGSGSIFGVGIGDWSSAYVYINSNNLYFADAYPFAYYANISGLPGGSGDAPVGSECHVALVFDGTNMMAFVNGRKVFTIARSRQIPTAEQKVWIGNQGGYGFMGRVRAMRVSNKAMYTDDFIPTGRFRR